MQHPALKGHILFALKAMYIVKKGFSLLVQIISIV